MCENAFAAIIVQQKYIFVLSFVKMFRPNKSIEYHYTTTLCSRRGHSTGVPTTSSLNEIIHTLTMTIVFYTFLPVFIYGVEQK